MQWLESHPYIASIVGAVALMFVGLMIIATHQPVATSTYSGDTWSSDGSATLQEQGANLVRNTNVTFQQQSQKDKQTIYDKVGSNPPFDFHLVATPNGTDQSTGGGFDFDGFMSQISQSSKKNGVTTNSSNGGVDAYAFVPSGLISTSTTGKKLSATQQVLYDYGNTIGSIIETYEVTHGNATRVLQAQFDDRRNPVRAAAVVALGRDLSGIGLAIEQVDPEEVPQSILAAHEALAKSYKELGANMQKIPDQQYDSDLLKALDTYNASVNNNIKRYLTVINVFGAYGVTFAENESGHVFVFTNAQSI
jgi:hypothetical protein